MNANIRKIVDVRVESDLYVAGRDPEEGYVIHGESFKVVAEFEGGEAYAHEHHFRNKSFVDVWADDLNEMVRMWEDSTDECVARAARLCDRVKAHIEKGGNLDMAHWHFHRTIYGSAAYLEEVASMTPAQRAGEE
jgi:hypothetical protein